MHDKKADSWLGAARRPRMPDLGERERQVLDCLWEQDAASAQQVLGAVGAHAVSLATIQSTLERLHRKGLLRREKRSRAYHYSARLDRAQFIGWLLRDIADDVAGGDLAPMVSGFVEFVGSDVPDIEATLARLFGDGSGRNT